MALPSRVSLRILFVNYQARSFETPSVFGSLKAVWKRAIQAKPQREDKPVAAFHWGRELIHLVASLTHLILISRLITAEQLCMRTHCNASRSLV